MKNIFYDTLHFNREFLPFLNTDSQWFASASFSWFTLYLFLCNDITHFYLSHNYPRERSAKRRMFFAIYFLQKLGENLKLYFDQTKNQSLLCRRSYNSTWHDIRITICCTIACVPLIMWSRWKKWNDFKILIKKNTASVSTCMCVWCTKSGRETKKFSSIKNFKFIGNTKCIL